MDEYWIAVAWALLPTIAVCVVFYLVLRGILLMDRTERSVYARIESERRAERGMPPVADDSSRSAG